MPKNKINDQLKLVSTVIKQLQTIGFSPILIGGMALVILGSKRVTYDFDFVISKQEDELLQALVDVFYKNKMELVAKIGPTNDILSTIDNPKMAGIRLRIDKPESAYFYNEQLDLRIDILFDFPLLADELIKGATIKKINSVNFTVASEEDLIKLKKIARSKRSKPGDSDDLAFLMSRRSKKIY